MAEREDRDNSRLVGKLLIAGAAIWFLVLRGVNAVKIVFDKITIKSVTAESVTMGISMWVRNPLITDITVNNIIGDVYLMNIPVAKVDYPVNSKLYGVATNRFELNFIIQQSALTEAIWANIQTGNVQTLICRFVGNVEINHVKIPVDREFTFNELIGN